MKTIGERISYKHHPENYTTFVISTKIERWKETLLLTWIIAWTFSGAVFLYFLLLGELGKEEKLILFVLSVFWAYFEYRIVRVFLWRKYGVEYIKIDEDKFTIKKSILGYGKAKSYLTQQIDVNKVESLKQNPKSFAKVMNDSFWVMGEGAVRFSDKNDFVYFGHQLEAEDSEKLAKTIKSTLKKYKNHR